MNSTVLEGILACNRVVSIAIIGILWLYIIGNRFEQDSFALPVPSEDDNSEDGYKVDKIRTGRDHWY